MKKFILHILLFFAIVAVVDLAAGYAFHYLQANKAKGGTESEYYICNNLQEDILIMGSSRAAHHYVAQMFADSLGLSCYNGGQDGNGIVMQYGRWKMIAKHHLPKLIIYDIEPSFDLSGNDNTRYIDRLKPFADDKDVMGYIARLFPMERLKLQSRMYRYNYKFLEIMSDCARPGDVNKGYKPNYGHIREEMINDLPDDEPIKLTQIDPVKMDCLNKLVTEAKEKGVIVVLVSSPYWKGFRNVDLNVIADFANEHGIIFLDYAGSNIRNNPSWFADSMHLNDNGAGEFTGDLIGKLRALYGI